MSDRKMGIKEKASLLDNSIKEEVINIIDIIDVQLNPQVKMIQRLFEVYNLLDSTYKADMHCPDCRRAVKHFFRETIKEWKKKK